MPHEGEGGRLVQDTATYTASYTASYTAWMNLVAAGRPVEEAGNINLVRVCNAANPGGCPLAPRQVGIHVTGCHLLPGPYDPHIQQMRSSLQDNTHA